jgi:tetratricopeptide (TPR) repeat protein
VLNQSPEHPAALNNLAYILANQKNDPAQALPLALRAFASARGNPEIADTVAWTYHLVGNDAAAEAYSAVALKFRPNSTDIQLHAAFVLAGIGKVEPAIKHLNDALKAKPELADRDDVKALRARLTRGQ